MSRAAFDPYARRVSQVLDLEWRILRYFDATDDDRENLREWPHYEEVDDPSGRRMTALCTRVGRGVLIREYSTGVAMSRKMMLEDLDRDARILYDRADGD